MEEIEVKFLGIDRGSLEARIIELGGLKEFDAEYRIAVFDHPDLRLNQQNAWVRLRTDGHRTTLTFKQRQGVKNQIGENDTSMTEYEVVVSDFEATAEILRRVGLAEKFQEEKSRIRYKLGKVELDIDEMPLLPPYLEIEADSWEEIDQTIAKLGLNPADKKIFSAFQIYEQNGINMLDYRILKFDQQVKR